MGEIAEMMLDGTLCEQCGTFIGEPCEHPRLCNSCDGENKKQAFVIRGRKNGSKMQCQKCGKWVTVVGMGNHLKDAHAWETK